ncbi:MAG: hypothetical protein RLZ84_940 [Actinomycetota bacterium]|jgi:hypothetical protein
MPVSEKQRFEMHSNLKSTLGDDVADTLMEYLPPVGWADIARRADVDRLERRFNFAMGIIATVGIGIIAVQVQILVLISSL